jgi:hypothetical protein
MCRCDWMLIVILSLGAVATAGFATLVWLEVLREWRRR